MILQCSFGALDICKAKLAEVGLDKMGTDGRVSTWALPILVFASRWLSDRETATSVIAVQCCGVPSCHSRKSALRNLVCHFGTDSAS